MSVTLIDINDVEVRLYREDGKVFTSPGVVHLDSDGMLFGEDARARLRSNPQGGFDKFWSQLDEVPVAAGPRGIRHHADIAYRHLQHLIGEHGPLKQVLFVVPSDYSRAKLSLLLGIAQALQLEVTGFVDNAVANLACRTLQHQTAQFLDLGLHRTCVSRLEINERVRFASSQTLERSGKNHFGDIVINWIADCFLDQARFDPLQDAASEQLLFDQQDGWVNQLRKSAHINVGLEQHGRLHEISLAKDELISVLTPAFAALAAPLAASSDVVLSHHFAIYPQELLSNLNAKLAGKTAALETVMACVPELLSTANEIRLCRSLPQATMTAGRNENGS